jgi:transcription antitermination factor NusG
MPILDREDDMWPESLLDEDQADGPSDQKWWCIYTMSRREKELMRRLRVQKIAHYGPIIPKRYRSKNGRLRTSFIPLFPNYVFVLADEQQRYDALTTNCISKCTEIVLAEQLVHDLRQIRNVIQAGIPLTPESRLEAGDLVRVRSGPFANYEGTVVRREGKTRLLLSIKFLQKGVSMAIDEGLLEVK